MRHCYYNYKIIYNYFKIGLYMTHHVYCYIAVNLDLGWVRWLRMTDYGLEDRQVGTAHFAVTAYSINNNCYTLS